jgi:regulator of cell morphogenesis and NO signaling
LGFAEKNIKTICVEHEIDLDFFITIINTYSNEHYFPEKRLQTFNLLTIIEYLRKTHQYYMCIQIPLIERHIDALLQTGLPNDKNLSLVKKFFLDYKNELGLHIQREEMQTFPYIEELYKHSVFLTNESTLSSLIKKYSMKQFVREHNNIDEKLFDLQNILIKYISGSYDDTLCTTVIFELFKLEKDIQDHTRIEEKVLKPMVIDIEKTLKP